MKKKARKIIKNGIFIVKIAKKIAGKIIFSIEKIISNEKNQWRMLKIITFYFILQFLRPVFEVIMSG
jgi:hypothetical protein